METEDIPTAKVSNWEPVTDQHLLALLGKLGEEASELSVKLFRSIIQGFNEADPTTGIINRKAVEDEIADVQALAQIAINELGLNRNRMVERIARKIAFKQPWFDYLRTITPPPGPRDCGEGEKK